MGANENLTIVFTDIVGYTELTGQQTRAESKALLRRHDDLLLPIVRAYAGRRIKTIGDAMLLGFTSPTDAVHCGMAMQDALADMRSKEPCWDNLHIRVAINLGEVRLERNDVFGEPVNIAARLESLTPPDEVWFTEAVYLAMNKAEVPSESAGEHRLKGIPDLIRVYRVPSYKATRLVGAGDEVSDDPALPFDGAHLRRSAKQAHSDFFRRPIARVRRQLANSIPQIGQNDAGQLRFKSAVGMVRGHQRTSLLLLLLLVSSLYWILDPSANSLQPGIDTDTPGAMVPAGEDWLKQAETVLESGDRELLQTMLEEQGDSPAAQVILGHLEFRNSALDKGVDYYASALQINPTLAGDSWMARNLGHAVAESGTAAELIKQHQSEEMLEALAWYSGQPNYYRRTAVIQLLEQLGQSSRIDWFGHYVEELRGRSECEDRKTAILKLRELGDARAIEPIEQALEGGLGGWWKSRCLRKTARETINSLQNQSD